MTMQFGVLDLVDWYPETMTQEARYRQVVDLAVLAEELGFDTYWVGEHHFSRYISPHPAVLLSAIASRTSRIRLGTSVALAAHHHPLRLAEDYAMVDLLSGGRLDLVVGRGLFLGGYQAFGIPYESVRPALEAAVASLKESWAEGSSQLQPRPVQRPHPPIWVAGGRAPASVDFAAAAGLPLALPQLNGPVDLFKPMADRYRERWAAAGHPSESCRLSVGQHLWVGQTDEAALEGWRESYPRYMRMVAAEMSPDLYDGTELEEAARRTRQAAEAAYERVVGRAACIGSPDRVVARILEVREALAMDHFWAAFNLGGLPTTAISAAMALFAREVIPAVRSQEA